MTETENAPTVEEEIAAAAREVERLEAEEQRRAAKPRPIAAAKIKLLELQKRQMEAELEPLYKEREEAHERLEDATARRWKTVEDENAARAAWSRPNVLIEKRERRLKDLDRQIAELRGEA
jgi:hypothetical protein